MRNYTEITSEYLNFCRYQKGLNSKTIKAYTIDLRQYYEFNLCSDYDWFEKGCIEEIHIRTTQNNINLKLPREKLRV